MLLLTTRRNGPAAFRATVLATGFAAGLVLVTFLMIALLADWCRSRLFQRQQVSYQIARARAQSDMRSCAPHTGQAEAGG
jgi:hypothetical protein